MWKSDRCYLVAEMGCNHCGDLSNALLMTGTAAWAGVDSVKLQLRDVWNPPEWWATKRYDGPNSYGPTYLEHRQALELREDEYAAIVASAREHGMDCGASVWDVASVDTALRIGVDWLKIPSAMVTNHAVVERVAEAGKPVILSTGMSTEGEVVAALKRLLPAEQYGLAVLACTSAYPCQNKDVHLRSMLQLQRVFDWVQTIGVSGHWCGLQIDAAARALGAMMIERHFTLDRNQAGTDHHASLEPDGLRRWVRDIRVIECALGEECVRVLECEESAREKLRGEG